MAKAVTLYNTSNEEVYPVTDASLVNGEIATNQIADSAVTNAKIDPGLIDNMGSYSGNEIETPYTWYDGRTVYKKTFWFGSCGHDGTTVSQSIGVTGGVDVFKIEGVVISATSNQAWALPFYWDNNVRGTVRADYDNLYVNVWSGQGSVYDSPAYITLYYAKRSS